MAFILLLLQPLDWFLTPIQSGVGSLIQVDPHRAIVCFKVITLCPVF